MLDGVTSHNHNICFASSTMSDYILDTRVKISWIEQKFLEGHPREKKVHLNSWSAEITGENKGLVSFIIRLTLNWSEDDRNLPKSVIVKSPTAQKFKKFTDDIIPGAGEVFEGIGDFIPMVSFFWHESSENKVLAVLLASQDRMYLLQHLGPRSHPNQSSEVLLQSRNGSESARGTCASGSV